MIAARNQCGAGWRAKGGRVKLVVAESAVGEALKVRRLNWPTESAACPKANIVRQDEENVRGSRGRFDTLRKIRSRVLRRSADCAFERGLWLWQDILPKRGRCQQ